jgi:hypothetical protein
VTVVLGQRATVAALAGRVRPELHATIRSARPYVEGRPVRVVVTSKKDLVGVEELVAVKLRPQVPSTAQESSPILQRSRTRRCSRGRPARLLGRRGWRGNVSRPQCAAEVKGG